MDEKKILPKSVVEKACDFLDGEVYALQELSDCVKWLAEVQLYQGSKNDVNIYNGGNACDSWYIAKLNQTLSEKMVLIAEKILREEITK